MAELDATVTARMRGMEPGPIPTETGLGEIPSVPAEEIQAPPMLLGDPVPFDIDGYVNESNPELPIEKVAENRESWAKTLYHFAKPWMVDPLVDYGDAVLTANYKTAAALNRGTAAVFARLDGVRMFLEQNTGGPLPNFFKTLEDIATREADYLQKEVDKKGICFLDEIIAEGIGELVPGVLKFSMDLSSLLTIPYMDGYYRATTRGDDPMAAGLMEAARTGILGAIFKMMGPLDRYLKMAGMGSVGAIEGYTSAPEGEKVKGAVKGGVIMGGYGAMTPGGRMGLNEVARNFEAAYPRITGKIMEDLGALGSARTPWFPEKAFVIRGKDYKSIMHSEDWKAGKEQADNAAADRVVDQVWTDRTTRSLQKKFQDPKDVIYISQPSTSRTNVIPDRLAKKITDVTGAAHIIGGAYYLPLHTTQAKKTAKNNRLDNPREFDSINPDNLKATIGDKQVVIVEDTLTSGGSVVDFIQALRNDGIVVKDVVSLFGEGRLAAKAGVFLELDTQLRVHKIPMTADDLAWVLTREEIRDTITPELRRIRTDEDRQNATAHLQGLFDRRAPKDLGADSGRRRSEEYAQGQDRGDGASPGGVPLGDVRPLSGPDGSPDSSIKQTAKDLFKSDRGSIPFAPEKRPRKFLKTVEESLGTDPPLAEKVKEIDPQDYLVQPNAESLAKAEARINTEGLQASIDYAKGDAPLSAEKGATFITLIEKAQKDGNYDQAVELVAAYDVQLREAGRFVQAASLWNKLSAPAFIRWSNRQLESVREKYGWMDTILGRKPESFTLSKEEQLDIIKTLRDINQMPEGLDKTDATLQLIDKVAQKVPPSASEMIDAFRYQNMLSSPRTQMRNVGTNVFNTFMTRPVDITTRGAIDYTLSALTGAEREFYVKDVATYYKGAINAVPNAVHAFTNALRLKPGAEIGKPETGVEAKGEFQRARAKQLPTSLTLVSRFMEASDKFNAALIGGGETAIQLRNGKNEVDAYKAGSQAAELYLMRKKLNPNDSSLSLPSKALSSLGKMMEETRKLPGIGPISKWYVPFIKTPVNAAIMNVEHSPLGAIRGKWDKEAGAKVLAGSIVTAVGAVLAYQNETTWAPPSNEEEKAWMYASGRVPYSFRIGDSHIPIWYAGPFALAIGIPAAVKHYLSERSEAITEEQSEKLFNLATGLARVLGSQTSTQNIGALFSALHGDIDYKFSSQSGFTAGQVIPAGALVRYINTILDPIVRHPKGFLETIEKDLPILSERIEARMTPFLEESRRLPINKYLPWDIGRVNPVYEAMMPVERYKARASKIESKMDAITEKVRKKEITVEESLEEMIKIMGAEPKSAEQFGRELTGKAAANAK